MRHKQSRRDSSGAWYIDSAALTQVCRDYDAGAAGDRHDEIVDYPSRSLPPMRTHPVIVDEDEYTAKYFQRMTYRLAVESVRRGMRIRTYSA